MKRMRLILSLAAMLAFVLCLAGCQSEDYTPKLGNAKITPPAIGEADTLRAGVNTSKSPLAGMGNSKIIGIDVDIAAAMADELGLKLSVVDVGTTPEKALEDGTVDIVMGCDDSETINGVWMSKSYLPTGVAVFALKNANASAPTAGDGKKIAAQVSSKSAWAVTNAFGDEALVSADDLSSAISQLTSGQVDYLASDAVIGMYAASRAGADLEIVTLIDSASGYCVGVKDSDTELKTSIADVLSTLISNGTIGVIEEKWLGSKIDLSSVPSADMKTQDANTDGQADGETEGSSSSASSSASGIASNAITSSSSSSNSQSR